MIKRAESPEDFAFIVDLAVRSVLYGVPSTRDVKEESIQKKARESLQDLDRQPVVPLIAWEGERRVGYLILELNQRDPFSGECQTFIYDLAVEPDRWGAYVVHRLVAEAARVTASQGERFMQGEVTRDNLRTLVQARRLGFVIERVRVGIGCGPEGRVPLERREETAYTASRKKKKTRLG